MTQAPARSFRELWRLLAWAERRRLLVTAALGLLCFLVLCGAVYGEVLLVLGMTGR